MACTTKYEMVRSIATNAKRCATCGGDPNPANFGGMCDPCDAKRKARLHRSAAIVRQHGHENAEFGQALAFLGYGR